MNSSQKRFVIEAYNHFIKIAEQYNFTSKADRLNQYRNAYICGYCTEREAIDILAKENKREGIKQ